MKEVLIVSIGSFFGGGGGFGGFGGGRSDPNAPRRGDDVQARVTISFEEAAKGCKRKIEIHRIETCPDCGGSGAQKGSTTKTCPDCGGTLRKLDEDNAEQLEVAPVQWRVVWTCNGFAPVT